MSYLELMELFRSKRNEYLALDAGQRESESGKALHVEIVDLDRQLKDFENNI